MEEPSGSWPTVHRVEEREEWNPSTKNSVQMEIVLVRMSFGPWQIFHPTPLIPFSTLRKSLLNTEESTEHQVVSDSSLTQINPKGNKMQYYPKLPTCCVIHIHTCTQTHTFRYYTNTWCMCFCVISMLISPKIKLFTFSAYNLHLFIAYYYFTVVYEKLILLLTNTNWNP